MLTMLGPARISLQVDVGFGDAITPAPEAATFPTLLAGFPAPTVRAYPAETVVAEKFHAMVVLGVANTRMKDFYDVWVLAGARRFDGQTLGKAIAATFLRRGATLPHGLPSALGDAFAHDAEKQLLWRAFLARGPITPVPGDLPSVVDRIRALVLPLLHAHRDDQPRPATWTPGAGWQ